MMPPKPKRRRPAPLQEAQKGQVQGRAPRWDWMYGWDVSGGNCIPAQQAASPLPISPPLPPSPTDPCPGQKPCNGGCIATDQCCTREDCPTVGHICCNGGCTGAKLETGSFCNHHSDCCSEFCRDVRPGVEFCA